MAIEIFKALHVSTPIYIRDLFEEKDIIYNLCSIVSLKQLKSNTVTYGFGLPNEIKNSITLVEFKNQIKNGKEQSVFAMCTRLL